MLSGEGNENGEKTTIGLISKKSKFARAAHFFCTFLCIAVVLHDCKVKLPEISQLLVYGGIVVRVLVQLCFHCRSFSPWWPLAFLIFSPPLQSFHVFLPTKNVSFVFYLSLLLSVALFLVELRWPIAYTVK